MGFYGGRPGQHFQIYKVFQSFAEMQQEAENTQIPGADTSNNNYWNTEVPINSFVLILQDEQHENQSTIYIKNWDGESFKYEPVGTIGKATPEIDENGNWAFAGVSTGTRAIPQNIELSYDYEIAENPFTAIEQLNEDGTVLEPKQYGLSNLEEKYKEMPSPDGEGVLYELDPEGDYILVYKSDETYNFIYDTSTGLREELGHFKIGTWGIIEGVPPLVRYNSSYLKWKYNDEKEWHDLFEISALTNITEYRDQAVRAAQEVNSQYNEIKVASEEVSKTKEEVDKTAESLKDAVNTAEGGAERAEKALEEFKTLWTEKLPEGFDPNNEVIAAREGFITLKDKLDNMPFQFDTISEMQKCLTLSIGDRCITFGRDNIGDGDSSKLFGIFDKNDEKLEETKPDSEEKVIAEQYPIGSNLVAGLLAIFSGTGGSGGGGAGVPSISVTGTEFSVKEGDTITLDYYWSGPTAGVATLFVTDSNKNSPKVVDYLDETKVYSSGVQISGFGAGSITLKPTRGEHNYTFYIIDRANAYSNEVKVKVIVGGISLGVNLADGQTFSSNDAIFYTYQVNTIYSKPSVLEYTIYQNGTIMRQGTQESTSSSIGLQSITLNIKSSSQNIGSGEFRIQARAFVKDDPNTVTDYIIRSFVIMESGVIYLTSSYNDDNSMEYQDTPFYIPLQLIYVGGSNFVIEGRYGLTEDFDWDTASKLSPPSADQDNAGSFTYPVTFMEVGTYYLRFKVSSSTIEAEGYSRVIKVNVNEKKSIYPLQRVDALRVHYSARKGQTNETNKNTWENISPNTSMYNALLVGFNYASNGWETKSEQTESGIIKTPTGYLHCNSSAYVSSSYPFFSNVTETQGATFEIVFKAVNIGEEQTILSMTYADGAGIFIYKDKIVLNAWGINNLVAYYNINGVEEKDKPIHVAVTIDPVGKYANIYVNGVLTRATAEMSFSKITAETRMLVNRGLSETKPQFGIVKIDAIRFYTTALNHIEILRNYVYNLREEKEQNAVWSKNYLDIDDINAIPDEIPYMTFYLTKDDWATMTKDEKKTITITYHDPNPPEGNETDYTWKKVKTSWQGTSSIAYPIKNFKIKLKDKYYIKGKDASLAEKTFCLKADYMDSSHCHNTGNANFIHETGLLTNYALTPAQSKELNISPVQGYKGLQNLPSTDLDGNELDEVAPNDLKTRTCIYGHPIALYIALEMDDSPGEYETPIFWGIYNFNFDKGSNDSFGLQREDDDFQNVTSFEIAANSAYDGGGFRSLRFIKKKNEEKYGWAKWNVGYTKDKFGNYIVDLYNGEYIYVVNAYNSGATIEETRLISFDYEEKKYFGVYNKNKNIKGVSTKQRFSTEDGKTFIPNENGPYIQVFQLDDETDFIHLENDAPVSLGYYDYTTGDWSDNVPKDSSLYDLKENWELYGEHGSVNNRNDLPKKAIVLKDNNGLLDYVILKDPENKKYKYKYYEADFELRYPDPDAYLLSDGDSYNKLYYKEYDKIIKMVEWVDNVGIDNVFKNEFSEHFDKDTLINYYLMLMTVGLIDNFGKNLMIDTWGYDKNGNIPYELFTDTDGKNYHKVWKYISEWDSDEEVYLDDGYFIYGLMDVENPVEYQEEILGEDGLPTGEINTYYKYEVYSSDENYSFKGELLEEADFGGTTDDRITGWYHETDISQILWYTHFYDLDSCLGVNNSGELTFTPSMEMNDNFYIDMDDEKVDNAPFNTSNSALWQQLVTNFNQEIYERFLDLISKRVFNLDTFKKYYYKNIISEMGERMYNADSYPKYLSREPIMVIINGEIKYRYPYSYDHLALGNDWERISVWLKRRINYLSTMFKRDLPETGDGFELRTESGDYPYNIELECYDPMYMRIVYKNGQVANSRLAKSNGVVQISIPASGAPDQEIYICPGNNVKKFKEISNPQLGFSTAKLDNAQNLLELNLANSRGLREITQSTEGVSLIKKINVENCEKLTTSISGANYPYLEYINTLGTNLMFEFNQNGGSIKTALLEGIPNQPILSIKNHSDLKQLTVQLSYPNGLPQPDKVAELHTCGYSSITLENCQNSLFKFTVQGRYKEEGVWQEITGNIFANFISNYGIFSLFPKVSNLIIRNSLRGVSEKLQLQPNGKDVLPVKELQISLPLLRRLEVIDTDFNKIALVSATRKVDGIDRRVGYPGWGGAVEVTRGEDGLVFTGDSNYISTKQEGIIGDSKIEELEFRNTYPPDSNESTSFPTDGKFDFPWRIYLGSLTGLKRLKFNTNSITAKRIKFDENGVNGDPNYLTLKTNPASGEGIDEKGYWKPAKFELILPSPPKDEEEKTGLELIYFGPNVTNIEFTSIRQKDTNIGEYIIENGNASATPPYNWPNNANYFALERVGRADTEIGEINLHPFYGVDLRGYKNLVMNFRGLNKIKGIVGMNSLSVPQLINKLGENIFEGFFYGCKSLNAFHYTEKISDEILQEQNKKPAIYNYTIWDFSKWFDPTYGKNFKNISRFFFNCESLSNTTYLQGLLNYDNAGFSIESAYQLFGNCKSLESVDLNWGNSNSTLHDEFNKPAIEGLFSACLKLKDANIKISGIDITKPYITSLNELFIGCENLLSAQIILLTDDAPSKTHMKNIETIDGIFSGCIKLPKFDFTTTFDSLDIDSQDTYLYDFDSLISAKQMFNLCKELTSVKFIDSVNFTSLEDFSGGFQECGKLVDVFNNSIENVARFYDKNKSNKDLALSRLFQNCSSLGSIKSFAYIDAHRVTDMESIFSGCRLLGTDVEWETSYASAELNVLDLSNLVFDITEVDGIQTPNRYVNISSFCQACSSLKQIKLPIIYAGQIGNAFNGCSNLDILNVSSIIPQQLNAKKEIAGLNNFLYVFAGCNNLAENFTGYQNWNMDNATDLTGFFQNCTKLVNIDLTNWKILNSPSRVTLSAMFEGCGMLEDIQGLNNLFGTYEDVLNLVEGKYNKKLFAPDGVQSLFNGCLRLKLGENDNTLAAWAKMATEIQTVENMFFNCQELSNLNKVFGKVDINGKLDTTQKLYWGSIKMIGTFPNQIDCKFKYLTNFKSMCENCIKLINFDYFTDDKVSYSANSQYLYPENIYRITANCSNLERFAFTITGARMENLLQTTQTIFTGCSKIKQITLPSRDLENKNNKGIKWNIGLTDLSADSANEIHWNAFTANLPSYLYDYASNGQQPEDVEAQGSVLVTTAQKNTFSALSDNSTFVQALIDLGWSLRVPEN